MLGAPMNFLIWLKLIWTDKVPLDVSVMQLMWRLGICHITAEIFGHSWYSPCPPNTALFYFHQCPANILLLLFIKVEIFLTFSVPIRWALKTFSVLRTWEYTKAPWFPLKTMWRGSRFCKGRSLVVTQSYGPSTAPCSHLSSVNRCHSRVQSKAWFPFVFHQVF